MPTTTTRKRLTGPMSRRLLSARNEAGLSRKALADHIGISERAVAYYEDPKYGRARKPIVVRAWAEACGHEFEEVWGAASKQPILRSGWLGATADLAAAS
jgi:transcriptional regulator with XRE-family HTH domain